MGDLSFGVAKATTTESQPALNSVSAATLCIVMSEAYRFVREREEVQCRREGCKDKKVVMNIAWILLQLVAAARGEKLALVHATRMANAASASCLDPAALEVILNALVTGNRPFPLRARSNGSTWT